MLLSIHYMVKHGETLWVTMSNGLCNETHLNLVTKCHYPQAPILNLCLASGKGELSSSATVCWDCLWSGAFCTHLPLRPRSPSHSDGNEYLSEEFTLGLMTTPSRAQKEPRCAILPERVMPAWCSHAILSHRWWWRHPHLWGRSEGIGNMPWREFWKPQKYCWKPCLME